jgi:hypothetical protein
MYTPSHPNMPRLSVAFFNEANRVLNRQTHLNTLTTCASLQLLCLDATSFGLNDESLSYIRKGVKIGTMMGLFDVHLESQSANAWLADDQDWKRAASYTAWGAFNWTVYVLMIQTTNQCYDR